MDLFTTALELAGIKPPTDRIIDGKSLVPALLNNKVDPAKVIYYYRGNEMMAVRHGLYKAHYWTWTNSLEERAQVCVFVMSYIKGGCLLEKLMMVTVIFDSPGLSSCLA